METSIKIKETTKKKLNLLKYRLDKKSIDEVIQTLLKISTQLNKGGKTNEKQK